MKNIQCPLCGKIFSAKEMQQGACSKCPFGKSCNLICCPNCGYSFPAESKTVNLIKDTFDKIVGKGGSDEQEKKKSTSRTALSRKDSRRKSNR